MSLLIVAVSVFRSFTPSVGMHSACLLRMLQLSEACLLTSGQSKTFNTWRNNSNCLVSPLLMVTKCIIAISQTNHSIFELFWNHTAICRFILCVHVHIMVFCVTMCLHANRLPVWLVAWGTDMLTWLLQMDSGPLPETLCKRPGLQETGIIADFQFPMVYKMKLILKFSMI